MNPAVSMHAAEALPQAGPGIRHPFADTGEQPVPHGMPPGPAVKHLAIRALQDVDLKLLRVFDAIVTCGGFSAAQALLNIGQPAISEYMTRLEIRLGAKLCERGRSGFRLTEAGIAHHAALRRLLAAIDEYGAQTASLRAGVGGKVHLGIIDNIITDPASPVPRAVRELSSQNPQAHVDLHIAPPNELEALVLNCRLHMAIGNFPHDGAGLAYTALYDELHGLYCGRTSPLHGRAAEPGGALLRDVRQARIVTRGHLTQPSLDAIGAAESAATVDSLEAQAILVMTGAYIGLLPRHYAQRWVESGDLQPLLADSVVLRSPFRLAVRKGGLQPPPVAALIQSLHAPLPSHTNAATRARPVASLG